MPLLFSLGQHSALEAVRARLINGERSFAFLDDVYVTTTPNRVGSVHNYFAGRVAQAFENPHQHWQDSSLERRWNSATSVRRTGADRTVDRPRRQGVEGFRVANIRTRGPHFGNAGGPPRLRPSVLEESSGGT